MKKLYQLPRAWVEDGELPSCEDWDEVKVHLYACCRDIQDLFNKKNSCLDAHADLVSQLLQAESNFYKKTDPHPQIISVSGSASLRSMLSRVFSPHPLVVSQDQPPEDESALEECIRAYKKILHVLPPQLQPDHFSENHSSSNSNTDDSTSSAG